jgi:hypothetical protein
LPQQGRRAWLFHARNENQNWVFMDVGFSLQLAAAACKLHDV